MAVSTGLKRKMMTGIAIGALVYLGLSLYVGWDGIRQAMSDFRWSLLPGLLALSLVNYGVRFLKWHYYLRRIDVPLDWGDSLLVFLAGLMFSITPGKLGEVVKAYLVRERLGTRVSVVAPVVLAERLTDVTALVVLSLSGALVFDYGRNVVLAGVAVTMVALVFVSSRRLVVGLLRRFSHLPKIGRNVERVEVMYESAAQLLGPVPLLFATALSVFSWGAECLAFAWTFAGFGEPVALGAASFTYAVSTIVGALAMLPGGLGLTEASLTGLSQQLFGVSEAVAGMAAIIVRVCTLWFAVAVGAVAVVLVGRRFGGVEMGSADPD
jgi:uncharacterized protein (TIRG00374 family)